MLVDMLLGKICRSIWGGTVITVLLLIFSAPCLALNTPEAAIKIASQLCDSLNIIRPVVLDIRCGEWTPNLELEIRKALLARKVDVRESAIDKLYGDTDVEESDSLNSTVSTSPTQLINLDLTNADLIEVTLEQTYVTGEKRNLISFSRYQTPVYRFILKHISLQDKRLLGMQEYRLEGEMELENPGSILALKWYEPLVASTLIGSLLIMLWTLK